MPKPEVKVPRPSSAEVELQKQQASMLKQQQAILKQQQANQNILLQFTASQYGVNVQFDDAGNITGFEETDTEGKARRDEIQKLQEERSLAALKGELPVDPVLERNLEEQEATLRERLASQFGPGYETSTPGIETLDQFMQSAEGLRYGARTGQMTLAEQLALARQNSNMATGAAGAQAITGTAFSNPLNLAGAYGQAATGYGQAQQPYQFNRNLITEANAQEASLMQKYWGGIGELAGTVAFAPAGGTNIASLFSDRQLKDNIVKVGDTYWGPGIYIYTLKGGDGTPFLGLMADEVEGIRPDVIDTGLGFKMVNYRALSHG